MQYVALDDPAACWRWRGELNNKGYARIAVGVRNREQFSGKRRILVHRFFYEDMFGSVPEGLELDHLCRTRNCVNPWHLEPVTHLENSLRGTVGEYLRKRTHCKFGHELERKSYSRQRVCVTCSRARMRAYMQRKRKENRGQTD